jgi:hypothetical protein
MQQQKYCKSILVVVFLCVVGVGVGLVLIGFDWCYGVRASPFEHTAMLFDLLRGGDCCDGCGEVSNCIAAFHVFRLVTSELESVI